MKPPFSITAKILNLVSQIERAIGRVERFDKPKPQPRLRKSNRVKTLHGSLAIKGNTLDLGQMTALLNGKRVLAPQQDIVEVFNANEVYEQLSEYNPNSAKNLLDAHGLMMQELIEDAGEWRNVNVGVLKGKAISHMAPPAERVSYLMDDLFEFLKDSEDHPLIQGCVFHYEFEFIHPFQDGNGRMGRFWHTLMLYHYHEIFEYIPVESMIKEHQQAYYDVLETCDKAGDSTAFIEFSLEMILKSLTAFLEVFRPAKATVDDRIENAQTHFGNEEFSRKDYMDFHKTISTATASRDLKTAVEKKLLEMSGDKATSVYSFCKTSP